MFRPELWILLLIVFAGVEGLTAGLVSIWFCFGSIAALFACWLGGNYIVQIALFFIVSLCSMAIVRPLSKKYLVPKQEKTNADRILGQEGIVTEEINNITAQGQIQVCGTVWTARCVNDTVLKKGSAVVVERIEGVKAIVSPKTEGGSIE